MAETNAILAARFNDKLLKFAKVNVPKRVLEIQQRLALDLLTRVVLLTPVDTGALRGNWQVTISQIPTRVLKVKDKEGDKTIAKGTRKINSLKPNPRGYVIYLSNNMEYASYVENGTSKMAPRHMLRRALIAVNKAKLK